MSEYWKLALHLISLVKFLKKQCSVFLIGVIFVNSETIMGIFMSLVLLGKKILKQ